MNKLFPVAIAILLMLGAALWLLAPSSFNQYVYSELKNELSVATGTRIEIAQVETKSLSGDVFSITATSELGMQLFHIDRISYEVDKKSYKKPPIKVTNMTISGIETSTDPRLHKNVQAALSRYQQRLTNNELAPVFVIEQLDLQFKDSKRDQITLAPFNRQEQQDKALMLDLINHVLYGSIE
ncbi:hypothetical protein LP316_06550 [Thalassotalea sp. LPB0316]|uniref:hypothetical protein n=1 Tax=Thalassotalea sp. LPB0316 TaxID=2769490 RepID=UPI0018667C2F|nr:hypothetical protein [Thalassotalea sp. LPB0316]QOL26946.1 hypothetical protein LP316_06550 [Thalassotalea sp. LPB0316]